MFNKFVSLLVVVTIAGLVLGACAPAGMPINAGGGAAPTVTARPTPPRLEIYHWWTAPGEREAADVMLNVFKDIYPSAEVVENPVSGGGGVSQRAVLQARLAAGQPPDTFQTLGGAELKNYVDGKALLPLDELWQELKYAEVVPKPLAAAVTIGGHPYAVPLNMHLQNILYYNLKLFNELGLRPPATFDELLAACQVIKENKPAMTCLGLGSKEKWGDAFIFDSILLEQGGPAHYVSVYKGEVDLTQDAAYRTALEKFASLLPYVNSNHGELSWDQATGLLPSGQAAMTLMGTWAIGALGKGSGWKPGVDFGALTFPQKPQRILLFHPDTYGLAAGAPDPDTTMNWLRVVASPELQVPTDVIQGGLFARLDINPKEFPDPIRQELMAYVHDNPDALILDQHGSILPAAAQAEYWNILANFLASGASDVDGTIRAVDSMMKTYNVKDGAGWYQWGQ